MIFVEENDPILTTRTPLFDFNNPVIDPIDFTEKMHRTLNEHPIGAIGLASPQVGHSIRMFVMKIPRKITCFNPEIVSTSPEIARETEGCLSFPDLWLKIKRPIWIEVQFQDENGKLVQEKFENLAAACYSHELDHLNGIRFIDLVGPLVKKRAYASRIKAIKGKND